MIELISGKEALIALANGEGVEYRNANGWSILTSMSVNLILNDNFAFRLKPSTIILNGVEIPAPFKPTRNQKYFYLHTGNMSGYANDHYEENLITSMQVQFGAWRTEEEIKQVVAALREVFDDKN